MDLLFNATNLKSAITFLHLAGLALGVGGAWILDSFILKHLKTSITRDQYQVIEFVSKIVLTGLVILWVSGLLFVAYYYVFTPEFLNNQKVWAKAFIVTVLTINGLFVHSMVLPKLKQAIGHTLIGSLSSKETKKMVFVGTVSFLSWLFPIVLGVAKTLNFSVPAIDIVAFYLVTLALALFVMNLMTGEIIRRFSTPDQTGTV